VLSYILRRSLTSLFVIFVVVSASFFLIRMMPGNPMQVLYQQLVQQGGLTPAEINNQIKVYYGLQPHGPLLSQYFQYLADVAHGNFGRSISTSSATVAQIIKQALPWTIFLSAASLLVTFVIGILVGTIMAVFRKGAVAKVLTVLTSFFSSIPVYVAGLLLIWQVAAIHHLLPAQGAYSPDVPAGFNLAFIGSVLDHAILPVAAAVITGFGGWALMMKGSTISTLGADYIRASQSWGLTQRRITQTYVGRNSMLPIVTNLALALGGLFGGALFIETFFTYPGVAYYMVQAIDNRDYPVMMGCFILITTATVLANFLADLLYPLIDPRIARPGGGARGAAERRRSAAVEQATVRRGAAA
jgi:peptide/nickel transport system permease protein